MELYNIPSIYSANTQILESRDNAIPKSFLQKTSEQNLESSHPAQLQQFSAILDFVVKEVLSKAKGKVTHAVEEYFFPSAETDYDKIWTNIKD